MMIFPYLVSCLLLYIMNSEQVTTVDSLAFVKLSIDLELYIVCRLIQLID